MMSRILLPCVLVLALSNPTAGQPKAPADRLDGPPIVTAKAWAVADGATGKLLWGEHEAEPRPIASTTKIMTAFLVLRLTESRPNVLDEIVTFSERAAMTPGSSSKLKAGDRLSVRELLYGLMLPSGNDAAVALAEQFGGRFPSDAPSGDDPVRRFVAEMNRRASELGLKETSYLDANGLSRNLASPRDLATLTSLAMRLARFREYVATRRHECEVVGPTGDKRTVVWENTNHLLAIEGYDGVKTGTTTAAGGCLVASGQHGADKLIVVVLGSATGEARYSDARNLFRWAWQQRSHPAVGGQ
jgi:D-alanyl-D-alanine carboxypeptidase (penicillin-binding protein 5/6)